MPLGLGEAGATVYVTGRTVQEGQNKVHLPGTIGATAAEVTSLGGTGIAVRCDHTDDAQTSALIAQIEREHGRLDLLVNNVWGGYEHYNDGTEFWNEQGFWTVPIERWDAMFKSGVRAHYVTSVMAAPLMIKRKRGLIVNISYIAAKSDKYGVAYGAAKSADDHMARCMAHELRDHGVAALSLYPGLVKTEAVMAHQDFFGESLVHAESPQLCGRAIAALAADPLIMNKSGRVLTTADLARISFHRYRRPSPRAMRE